MINETKLQEACETALKSNDLAARAIRKFIEALLAAIGPEPVAGQVNAGMEVMGFTRVGSHDAVYYGNKPAPARPPWPMNGPFRALFRNQQWLVVDRDSGLVCQCLCETEAKALALALTEFPAAVEWMREHADRYPLDDNTPSTEKAMRASRDALLARVDKAGFALMGAKETER